MIIRGKCMEITEQKSNKKCATNENNIVRFERKDGVAGSYIVFEIDCISDKSVEIKMLENNNIQGLLACDFRYEDNSLYLYYDIKDKISFLDNTKNKKITYDVIYKVYGAIVATISVCEKYLISPDSVLLMPELVFVNRKYSEFGFCVLPEYKCSYRKQIREFTEKLMKISDHGDKKSVELIYGIYDVVSNDDFFINDIKEYINDLESSYDSEKKEDYQEYDVPRDKSEFFSLVRGRIHNVLMREFVPEIIKVKKSVSYGCGMEEVTHVGRDCENEVVLPQNYISRKHAILEADENFLYVTDKGSLNGTFVNGERIAANVKIRCKVQDEITFADISFIVV